MTLFLSRVKEGIYVQARLESEDGSAVGDISRLVKPGGSFMRYSYEELERMGEGGHEIEVAKNKS